MPEKYKYDKRSAKNKTTAAASEHSQNLSRFWGSNTNRPDPPTRPDPPDAEEIANSNTSNVQDNQTDNDDIELGATGDCNDDCDGNDGDDDELEQYTKNKQTKSHWPEHVCEFFSQVKSEIDQSAKFKGRARSARFEGTMPEKYRGHFSPSTDPKSFFPNQLLTLEHFCLPGGVVWLPELLHKDWYPGARPKCKFHNVTTCVTIEGWVKSPRHCYCSNRWIALLGKVYKCSSRKEKFRGYDKAVLENSNDYIKMLWRKIGFNLSHRGGMSIPFLQKSRSLINHGMSVSGLQRSTMESMKQEWLQSSIMWRALCDLMVTSPTARYSLANSTAKEAFLCDFPDFHSELYHQKVPTISYLIRRLIIIMEDSSLYKTKRMQMIDGRHFSGDHSFKLSKMIYTKNSKPFAAVYCVLNEIGQVVAWWLTTGTGMSELENSIGKIKTRNELHGFDGPDIVSTDRCCQERHFWNKLFKLDSAAAAMSELKESDLRTIRVIKLPTRAELVTTVEGTDLVIGNVISTYIMSQPREQQVIFVDTEWKIGNAKADLLILALLDGRVFLFHLTPITKNGRNSIPSSLKQLLEDDSVMKIGNQVHNERRSMWGWGAIVKPTTELGHLARARALSPTKAPSIEFLIESQYPGVTLEGKDNGPPRISDWSGMSNNGKLTQDQYDYASIDGYIMPMAYKAIMQHMDPHVETPLLAADIKVGMRVVLYSRQWKSRVAEVVVHSESTSSRQVCVKLDLRESNVIFAPGAVIVPITVDISVQNDAIESRSLQSLSNLYNSSANETVSPFVVFEWPLHFCRRKRDPVGDRVELNTIEKQVIDDVDEQYLYEQAYDADVDEANGTNRDATNNQDCDSSDGEADNVSELPRHSVSLVVQYHLL